MKSYDELKAEMEAIQQQMVDHGETGGVPATKSDKVFCFADGDHE